MGKIHIAPVPSPVPILTEIQKTHLAAMETIGWTTVNGQNEWSRPEPLTIFWESDDEVKTYTVTLKRVDGADGVDGVDGWTRTMQVSETQITLDNFLPDTDYTVTVVAHLENGDEESDTVSFHVANELPRCLSVDGVTNVRDIGGYATENGGRVRCELLYRTGMLHNENGVHITEDGIRTMRETLGIRTEIDFRGEWADKTDSPLGENVAYRVIPMVNIRNNLITQADGIRAFFDLIAERENYPIAVHCSAGTDRTGVCIFLILSLCGVPETDVIRDYKFSNFSAIDQGRDGEDIQGYIDHIETFDGKSRAEKTEAYLLSIGIRQDTIDKVKTILTERKTKL